MTIAYAIGKTKYTTTTDASGNYSITGLPPGRCSLTFTINRRSKRFTVSVVVGQVSTLNVVA